VSFCQFCGKAVDAEARFCNACGKPANLPYGASPSSASPAGAVALPIESEPVAPAIVAPALVASASATAHSSVVRVRAGRPRGVTILAVLAFLAMIPTLALGVILQGYAASANAEASIPLAQMLMRLFPYLAQGQRDMVSQASAGAAILFVMAVFFAVMSYGLWTLRKWGRIAAIACGVLGSLRAAAIMFVAPRTLLWQLIVIGINIWIITYLLKPHVKEAFGARQAF